MPFTGLVGAAFWSVRYSYKEERAESLRRTDGGASFRVSKSFRQAITWARVIKRSSIGERIPAKVMNSFRSLRYARRVCGLSMLANHSVSGGTSSSWENSALVSALRGSVTGLAVRFLDVIAYDLRPYGGISPADHRWLPAGARGDRAGLAPAASRRPR